jgi:hypothetical protein
MSAAPFVTVGMSTKALISVERVSTEELPVRIEGSNTFAL